MRGECRPRARWAGIAMAGACFSRVRGPRTRRSSPAHGSCSTPTTAIPMAAVGPTASTGRSRPAHHSRWNRTWWFRDPATGQGRSLVAHDEPGKPALGLSGHEPTMRDYTLRADPAAGGAALRADHRDTWPIITLISTSRLRNRNIPRPSGAAQRVPGVVVDDRTSRCSSGRCSAARGRPRARAHRRVRRAAPGLLRRGPRRPTGCSRSAPRGHKRGRREQRPNRAGGRTMGCLIWFRVPRTNHHRWWNNPWRRRREWRSAVGHLDARTTTSCSAISYPRHTKLDSGFWFYTLNGLRCD